MKGKCELHLSVAEPCKAVPKIIWWKFQNNLTPTDCTLCAPKETREMFNYICIPWPPYYQEKYSKKTFLIPVYPSFSSYTSPKPAHVFKCFVTLYKNTHLKNEVVVIINTKEPNRLGSQCLKGWKWESLLFWCKRQDKVPYFAKAAATLLDVFDHDNLMDDYLTLHLQEKHL